MLAAPAAVGRVLGLAPGDRRALLLLRVLGARDLGQAVLAGTAPPPALRRLGAGVDALHAASMVALAAVSRDHRRPAMISAALADRLDRSVATGLQPTAMMRPVRIG